jgi:uncharacterized protein (DUF433 family)
MLDWSQCPAVERYPDRVSGAWVFRGTRVPVRALFENLESGARLEEFLEWFPGVAREQVEAVLEHASRSGPTTEEGERQPQLQGLVEFFATSPLRESGLEIERPKETPRDLDL